MTISRDAVRRALRTFGITTLALFVPGLLGWLNALTEWARGQGSTPFPDAHGLAYLGVSAITAGVVALVNLAWNAAEDAYGKGVLRNPSAAGLEKRNERGSVTVPVTISLDEKKVYAAVAKVSQRQRRNRGESGTD